MRPETLIVVAARNEAQRIAATIRALGETFPGAPVWVADDGSDDQTAAIARRAGMRVVGGARRAGKGRAMTSAVEAALVELEGGGGDPVCVLCDGDLGESARELAALVEAIGRGEADMAVAAFSTRAGGGFGIALAFARWVVRRRCGLTMRAPLSGQRAMRASLLRELLPFAHGYGMEIGMTIDAVRTVRRVVEIDLPLSHRPTGRTPAGFAHRGRQLVDFARVYLARSVRERCAAAKITSYTL